MFKNFSFAFNVCFALFALIMMLVVSSSWASSAAAVDLGGHTASLSLSAYDAGASLPVLVMGGVMLSLFLVSRARRKMDDLYRRVVTKIPRE